MPEGQSLEASFSGNATALRSRFHRGGPCPRDCPSNTAFMDLSAEGRGVFELATVRRVVRAQRANLNVLGLRRWKRLDAEVRGRPKANARVVARVAFQDDHRLASLLGSAEALLDERR